MSKNKRKTVFLIALNVVLAIVYVSFLYEYPVMSSMGAGAVFGAFIGAFAFAGILTLIAAGIYWVFRRRRMQGISTKTLTLSAVFIVLAFFGNTGIFDNKTSLNEARVAVDSISEIVSRADDEMFDEDGMLREAPSSIESQPNAAGMWGEVESVVRSIKEQERELNNAYVRAIDAAGWESLLDSNRLANDTNLEKSRWMVSQAQREVKLYRRKSLVLLESIPNRFERVNFDTENDRTEFFAGFNESLSRTSEETLQSLKYEQDIVDLCEQLIVFLHENQGTWAVQDDQVYFDTDDQVAAYNAIFDDLLLTIEQQNSFTLQRRLNQLKQMEKVKSHFK